MCHEHCRTVPRNINPDRQDEIDAESDINLESVDLFHLNVIYRLDMALKLTVCSKYQATNSNKQISKTQQETKQKTVTIKNNDKANNSNNKTNKQTNKQTKSAATDSNKT